MNNQKLFFRVSNIDTQQGLWYNWDGEYTGLIHNTFDFCKNKDLPMPFDRELVGWLSATENLKQLWHWFPKDDIKNLQEHGWALCAYFSSNWKPYKNHVVIDQKTSVPVIKFVINDDLEIDDINQIQNHTTQTFKREPVLC